MKAKRPKFVRHDFHKKARLKDKWRRPKGLQNKLRLRKKGKGRHISQGYRAPVSVRGLSKDGKKIFMIYSSNDLGKADPKNHLLVFSSSLGMQKRSSLAKLAGEKGFSISNLKDVDAYLKKVQEEMEKRKSKKTAKKAKAKPKKEGKKDKLADKVSKESKDAEEDKEKKEKDKLLIQRER